MHRALLCVKDRAGQNNGHGPQGAYNLIWQEKKTYSPSRAQLGKPQPTGDIQPDPACFCNAVLLKHSHTHLLTRCLRLLLCYNSSAEPRPRRP